MVGDGGVEGGGRAEVSYKLEFIFWLKLSNYNFDLWPTAQLRFTQLNRTSSFIERFNNRKVGYLVVNVVLILSHAPSAIYTCSPKLAPS